jgi:2-methylisocitrate lyase-like PEP mutase family enzyme
MGRRMKLSTILRKYLATPGKMVIAPGAYDGLSARLIAEAGFEAVYMTGGGSSASRLGQPDLGLMTLTEMADNAAMMVECTELPVIADADTGYGNALNVVRTVREYERAGVAAIHLEDQVLPKKCGFLEGKQLVPIEEFVQKIKAAVDSRRDPDFIVIARTDARTVYGFEEAIARANLCIEAGADVAFIEAPMTLEELEAIPGRVQGPCLTNVSGPASKTPALTTREIIRMGYKIGIYPAVCIGPVIHGIRNALKVLREEGIGWDPSDPVGPHELFAAVGLSRWNDLEKKYGAKRTD